jgi:hypothetical protein
MRLWCALLVCTLCWAQSVGNIQVQSTATQAVITYKAPIRKTCTIVVSESSSFSPPVADTDSALFPGAASESAHLISGLGAMMRTVRVGMRTSQKGADGKWHSRALAAETQHYVKITCNGQSATATFKTGVPGGFAPEPLPADVRAWGNIAYPEFDFTDLSKPVIDPKTGLKIYTADPAAWSIMQSTPGFYGAYSGGSGWTNPANVTAYGTGVAQTSSTNPISIFFIPAAFNDQLPDIGGSWPYDNFLDLGVDVYGSGTDSTAANRTIQLALSIDSGKTAYSPFVTLTLPAGGNQIAGTAPAQYPKPYFGGWGVSVPRNLWPKHGYVTAANGMVTLTKNAAGQPVCCSPADVGAYFVQDWAPGVKIWIANSAPVCPNDFCTITSVQSATQATIAENLTIGEQEYWSAALAVIVQKANTAGSVSLSTRFNVAKGFPHDIWTGGCASTTVVSGDGITGYPCIFPRVRAEAGALYFVGVSKPVIRLISLFANPGNIPGTSAADSPLGAITRLGPAVPSFDQNDPAIMYLTAPTNGGSSAIFKVQYTGNWTAYPAYNSSTANPPPSNELVWTNLTKSADHRDLRTQILANTNYDETRWPSLKYLQSIGVTGPYIVFEQNIGSQNTACWVFAFTAATGDFYRAWRSDDGSSNDALHYVGCHAVIRADGGAVLISNVNLTNGNSSTPEGGPYIGRITGVLRGGVFSADTSLPWPIDNSYDNQCPANLPAWIVARGASGNQCVTVTGTMPCSAFASVSEASANPCPYDATQSYLGGLKVGDFLKDPEAPAGADSEGFMVVQIAPGANGTFTAVLERNANFSYCSIGDANSVPARNGVDFPGQNQHANGWRFEATARDACGSSVLLLDIAGNHVYAANQNGVIGHFDATGSGTQADTWIGAGSLVNGQFVYSVQYNRPWANIQQPWDWTVPSNPPFAGYQSVHDVQSYMEAKQVAASTDMRKWGFDFRHYNGSAGADLEVPGQWIGGPTNLTLQPQTQSVYKLTLIGNGDVKHAPIYVWAGEKVLMEKSSPATGNVLTDADAWNFCYAYRAGECRAGSSAGDLYAVIPGADHRANCWASQVNLRVPCAMAGPVQAMQGMQVGIGGPDPSGNTQRALGTMLMGPGQQYVYSKLLPTPDASYLLFAGFLTSGYHTSLMMAKLPSFPSDGVVRSTFVPVNVSVSSSNSYVEFGYEEFGSNTDFFCTSRREACRVSAATINEANPFSFASETLAAAGSTIAIPAIPGRILYYRVVTNGSPGPLMAAAVP